MYSIRNCIQNDATSKDYADVMLTKKRFYVSYYFVFFIFVVSFQTYREIYNSNQALQLSSFTIVY